MDDAFKAIRKQSNDIFSRLRSIQDDAQFVRDVHQANSRLPLVANLRCGSWYCPPDIECPSTPAYFKSQDGHEGQWDFSLRRSNLHLLPLIAERGGIILVDSTRRGKRLPDALSKTIPQWCATINRALVRRDGLSPTQAEDPNWENRIYVSPRSVSESERTRMEDRLESWADKLLASSLTLPSLTYPLRPIFIHKPSPSEPYRIPTVGPPSELGFYPVLCLSASEYVDSNVDRRRPGGWEYHQGAGDDHESWGMGMGPGEWWAWREELLMLDRQELELEIKRRVEAGREGGEGAVRDGRRSLIEPTALVSVGLLPLSSRESVPTIAIYTASKPPEGSDPAVLAVSHRPGKDELGKLFEKSIEFARRAFERDEGVQVVDEIGKDISVGVAIVLLQTFFDERGGLVSLDTKPEGSVSKATIQRRLQWIINAQPGANPTRSTLKAVNAFFMSARFKPGV